jgi:hypothetical protein
MDRKALALGLATRIPIGYIAYLRNSNQDHRT